MDNVRSRLKIYRSSAFETIWYDYYPRLAVYVRGMIWNQDIDWEDLMQEIMLKVFKNLHSYNPIYSFNSWIYTIARNHFLDVQKKMKSCNRIKEVLLQEGSSDMFTTGQDDFENKAISNELKHLVHQYINTLEDVDRQISFLRFFESMKYRDIGKILKIPTGTIKYRVHVIRNDLKSYMEKEYGE